MSTFTRYAFSLLIVLYGIYQLLNEHPLPGVIAIVVALVVFWMSRRR